ncbi:glucose-6-phosphate dehydrogenase assembly protein OpcA [Anthocerotibacter panamensis]|uniref:glucose-6-phosphate dehydrogenase assembly protein OpcA n=1 Tax=Anthocerotibacter panamensis TaxID=2857077 RepID=UPI001C402096|nr:glucose-6-phosphate dehydrogenase assembly protein OpcA [Anthocerotibacter panamensis]
MTSETVPVVALREPKQVPVNQVDQELNRIWATQEDGQVSTRASTFNFVVYTSSQTPSPEDTIGAIAVQYPCRTLSIEETPTAPEGVVVTEVTAYCPMVSGGQHASICCEYVSLRAKDEALRGLYTTVLPLLLPDLPTYLWWRGSLALDDPLFSNLHALAERLIVDSGTAAAAADLLVLDQLKDRSISLGDLNWWRLLPWRELTARTFDDVARLAKLNQIQRLELEYATPTTDLTPPGNLAQPLLFIGWLASRLGWQFQKYEPENLTVFFASAAGPVEVMWHPTLRPDAQPGDLLSTRLDLSEGKYLTLQSGIIKDCVQMQLEEGDRCSFEHVASLRRLRLDELLAQELQTPSHTDPYYREALTVACAVLAP